VSPAWRGSAIRILLCLGAAAALIVFPAARSANLPAGGSLSALPAAVHGPAAIAPAIVPGRRKLSRHVTKARVGLFTASPATLPAAGGTVHLLAVVQSAATCRFSSVKTLKPLPATKSCTSGDASITVRLPKNTTSSARTYRFTLYAKGSAGGSSAGPVAVVESAAPTAPLITTQPSSSNAVSGSSVTFAAAAATAGASVQWQLSTDGGHSWSDISGANSPSYTFTAAVGENGYEYRAVFTSRGKSTPTSAAALTVSPAEVAPAVTLAPTSQSVVAGARATFTASASGSPAPSVQWQVSSDGGASWSAVPGATSTAYSLTATMAQSGYSYRAVFTNAAGWANTNAVTLTVSTAPLITQPPSNQGVFFGNEVTFTAAASGVPAPSVQWQLSTNAGASWSPIQGATSPSYSFIAVLGENGYVFRAVFTNDAGSTSTDPATLAVSTGDAAPAIGEQPASQSVVSGSLATFTASGSGIPTPSVQWQVSTDGITWSDVSGANSDSYSFTANEGENGYEYRALFTSQAGSATTSAATLTVIAPDQAPTVTLQPSSQSVVAGSGVVFTAAASGNPAPSVQWQVSTDGVHWSDVAGATSTSYAFTATSAENGDSYEAVFTNTSGTATTNAVALVVSDLAPAITSQPVSQTVQAGANATFSAVASGDPTPSVQWQVSMNGGATWGNVAGATAASYQFTAASSENGYEYRAVFTNPAGSATTGAAILSIGVATTNSGNWSGWVASGGAFSSVTGSWIVPTTNCSNHTTAYSAEWIGIDGATSSTVEQDGTDSDCSGASPAYYAWYEMYGDSAVNSGFSVQLPSAIYPVSPGDSISASVSLSGSTWTLAIADSPQGWHYATSVPSPSPAPAQSSAEWIAERPDVNGSPASLADFGSVNFTGASATGNGHTGPIADFSASEYDMVNGGTLLAAPGSLGGAGDSFTDTWYASK
jgi:hypothetical protein